MSWQGSLLAAPCRVCCTEGAVAYALLLMLPSCSVTCRGPRICLLVFPLSLQQLIRVRFVGVHPAPQCHLTRSCPAAHACASLYVQTVSGSGVDGDVRWRHAGGAEVSSVAPSHGSCRPYIQRCQSCIKLHLATAIIPFMLQQHHRMRAPAA